MSNELVNCLVDLKEDTALEIVKNRLNKKDDPLEILEDAMLAMEIIGKRFSEQTYFIPELVYAGEIMRRISQLVKPKLTSSRQVKTLGKFLIGTVAGDVHDIGKDIAAFMLEVSGFEVVDIGIDAPPQKFVENIELHKPDIVGLSCLLTIAFDSLKATIDSIKTAGLREDLKIIVGGSLVDEEVRAFSGADAFCRDAMCGVTLSKIWVGENKK